MENNIVELYIGIAILLSLTHLNKIFTHESIMITIIQDYDFLISNVYLIPLTIIT